MLGLLQIITITITNYSSEPRGQKKASPERRSPEQQKGGSPAADCPPVAALAEASRLGDQAAPSPSAPGSSQTVLPGPGDAVSPGPKAARGLGPRAVRPGPEGGTLPRGITYPGGSKLPTGR